MSTVHRLRRPALRHHSCSFYSCWPRGTVTYINCAPLHTQGKILPYLDFLWLGPQSLFLWLELNTCCISHLFFSAIWTLFKHRPTCTAQRSFHLTDKIKILSRTPDFNKFMFYALIKIWQPIPVKGQWNWGCLYYRQQINIT